MNCISSPNPITKNQKRNGKKEPNKRLIERNLWKNFAICHKGAGSSHIIADILQGIIFCPRSDSKNSPIESGSGSGSGSGKRILRALNNLNSDSTFKLVDLSYTNTSLAIRHVPKVRKLKIKYYKAIHDPLNQAFQWNYSLLWLQYIVITGE